MLHPPIWRVHEETTEIPTETGKCGKIVTIPVRSAVDGASQANSNGPSSDATLILCRQPSSAPEKPGIDSGRARRTFGFERSDDQRSRTGHQSTAAAAHV